MNSRFLIEIITKKLLPKTSDEFSEYRGHNSNNLTNVIIKDKKMMMTLKSSSRGEFDLL